MTKTSAKPVGADDLDLKIVERLSTLRASLGLSGAELDRLCAFGAGTTGRLERGEQRIYVSHLYRIANTVGISVEYFYAEDAVCITPAATPRAREARRLLDVYLNVRDPTMRHDISALVECMADEYETTPRKRSPK